MFRFDREKILPQFLLRRWTTNDLARRASVSNVTADRAINGLPITAPVVSAIADALQVKPLDFLVPAQILKG